MEYWERFLYPCSSLCLSQRSTFNLMYLPKWDAPKSHANNERLKKIILLIALAYTAAIFQGQKIQQMGIQKYVGRLTEVKRCQRRHSSFWMGLYGQSWVIRLEFCQDMIAELMRIRQNKLPFFQKGFKAMSLILSSFWRGCPPVRGKRILTWTQSMLQLEPTNFPCNFL